MAKLTLNGMEYGIDSLNEEAKAQVTNLRFVDAEIARLQAQLAVLETAKRAYAAALSAAVAKQPAAGTH